MLHGNSFFGGKQVAEVGYDIFYGFSVHNECSIGLFLINKDNKYFVCTRNYICVHTNRKNSA